MKIQVVSASHNISVADMHLYANAPLENSMMDVDALSSPFILWYMLRNTAHSCLPFLSRPPS